MRDATTSPQPGEAVKPNREGASHGGFRRGSARRFGGLVAGAIEGSIPSAARAQAAGASAVPAPADPARRHVGAAPGALRVLMGGAPGVAEARIRIADPTGGNAEIRLTSLAGGRDIAVQVLTAAAGSRETLTGVMNEVRLRLRRRGIGLTDLGAGGWPAEHDRAGGRRR